MRGTSQLVAASMILAAGCASAGDADRPTANPYAQWKNSFPPGLFPVGVWCQSPENAGKYKALGINCYVALWKGPTAGQIAGLKKHGMPVVCHMNEYARKNLLDDGIVVGWMHGDEPDLAHVFPRKKLLEPGGKELIRKHWPELYEKLDLARKPYKGWGLGANPMDIQRDYEEIKRIDPTRPVIINLSQCVVEQNRGARGDRTGHVEDYPEYIKGSDIVSFDIYPVAYKTPDKLWRVPLGIDNLNGWDRRSRPKWCAIECTFGRPSGPSASPAQVRAEVWMAIIHGARGIIYFVHWFDKGKCVMEPGLLQVPEMMAAVKKLNGEIQSLAPVICAPEARGLVAVSCRPREPLDFTVRRTKDAIYILSNGMRDRSMEATFRIRGLTAGKAEVIGENRSLTIREGSFTDKFGPFDTNLYRIPLSAAE